MSILRKIAVIQNKPLSEVEEKITRKFFNKYLQIEIKFVSLRNHDPWEDFFKKTSKIKAGLLTRTKRIWKLSKTMTTRKHIIEPLFGSFEKSVKN